MTRTPTRGEIMAWRASVPILDHPDGVDRTVLRRLKEVAPTIILRWHPKLGRVGIWEKIPGDWCDIPVLHRYATRYVDNRIVVSLAAGDRRKFDVSPEKTTNDAMVAQEQRRAAAVDRRMATTDPGEIAWAATKQIAEAEGCPWGVQVAVPANLPSTGNVVAAGGTP